VDILLAVQQPDLRLAIDLLLRETPGLNVVGVARETKALLAILRVTRPDLLLLDWALAGHPLINVLAKICEQDAQPKIIVLGTLEDDRETILTAGADAFVTKGESPQQLLTAIYQLMTSSESSDID
jgi:DNA-binding NarL/FixJ family response regulator